MTERFVPSVLIPEERRYGFTFPAREVTPEGWQWILAFALRGCSWAVEEASKPEFRKRMIASLKERKREELRSIVELKLDEIEAIRKEIKELS